MNLGVPAGPSLAAIPGGIMKILSATTLALLAAATLSLQAEAPRYGVQGSANIPLRDLKTFVDNKPGAGFGVHGTIDLGDGHMVRPRLDYSFYSEASISTSSSTVRQSASNLSLGGDYLYFIAGKPEALYLTVGVSAVRWSFEHKDQASDVTSDTTKFGMAGGVGYQWNATVGTEVRWLHSAVAREFKADAVQVGVTVRF
jgi:opacity protein-like surface antigen